MESMCSGITYFPDQFINTKTRNYVWLPKDPKVRMHASPFQRTLRYLKFAALACIQPGHWSKIRFPALTLNDFGSWYAPDMTSFDEFMWMHGWFRTATHQFQIFDHKVRDFQNLWLDFELRHTNLLGPRSKIWTFSGRILILDED